MKKCLITLKKLNPELKINYDNYDCFIGVEFGSKFLAEHKDLKNKYFISDFDSLTAQDFQYLKVNYSDRTTVLAKDKDYVDSEEAIKLANQLGYYTTAIEMFIDENLGRVDHLFNLFHLVYKYKIIIYGNKFRISSLTKKRKNAINKDHYHYLSIFIFKITEINSVGLLWNLSGERFDLESATKLISNEIKRQSAEIIVSEDCLVLQTND